MICVSEPGPHVVFFSFFLSLVVFFFVLAADPLLGRHVEHITTTLGIPLGKQTRHVNHVAGSSLFVTNVCLCLCLCC